MICIRKSFKKIESIQCRIFLSVSRICRPIFTYYLPLAYRCLHIRGVGRGVAQAPCYVRHNGVSTHLTMFGMVGEGLRSAIPRGDSALWKPHWHDSIAKGNSHGANCTYVMLQPIWGIARLECRRRS